MRERTGTESVSRSSVEEHRDTLLRSTGKSPQRERERENRERVR
jgi:hypothetical protein